MGLNEGTSFCAARPVRPCYSYAMYKAVNLVNKRFGSLVAVKDLGSCGRGRLWLCKCDCGGTREVAATSLRSNGVRTCGSKVHRRDPKTVWRTHGEAGVNVTPEYRAWTNMKQRCFSETNASFKDYGARGITVCARWRDSFENFLADMGRRPSAGATLERRDVNKGYKPSNCFWATRVRQARNRRHVQLSVALAEQIRNEPRGRWGDARRAADKYSVTIHAVRNVWYHDTWSKADGSS